MVNTVSNQWFFSESAMLKRLMFAVVFGLSVMNVCYAVPAKAGANAAPPLALPILVYHRFGPTVADSMTMKTVDFESNLRWLAENGYRVIPLRQYLDYRQGKGPAPAAKSVVITIDDGHKSVYSDVLPLIKRYKIPVTLFIYPSVISNASYGMTWDQLKALVATGYVDIQSHTYWHPNFKQEKKRLTPNEFDRFARVQLEKSKRKLEQQMGSPVRILAWPFGIYSPELEQMAETAGYEMALSIDRRHANQQDAMMAVPRYLITAADHGTRFARLITQATPTAENGKRVVASRQ